MYPVVVVTTPVDVEVLVVGQVGGSQVPDNCWQRVFPPVELKQNPLILT